MVDLNKTIPGAKNFKYKEFVESETALRRGICNEPTAEQWQCIEKLARKVIQPIRRKFGRIRITSGFRSPELCLHVGSSIHSNHTRGQACDIKPLEAGVDLIDIVEYVYNELPFRELIAEYFPKGWCHIAYRREGNDRILKLKDNNHNFKIMTLKELKDIYR